MPSHIVLLGVAVGVFHLINSVDSAVLDQRGMAYMLTYCVVSIYISAWFLDSQGCCP